MVQEFSGIARTPGHLSRTTYRKVEGMSKDRAIKIVKCFMIAASIVAALKILKKLACVGIRAKWSLEDYIQSIKDKHSNKKEVVDSKGKPICGCRCSSGGCSKAEDRRAEPTYITLTNENNLTSEAESIQEFAKKHAYEA